MQYILHKYGLAAALCFSALPLSAEQMLLWEPSMESAQRQAAQTQRLIYLHFWAPWCAPCQRMETEVFNQKAVAAQVGANYVAVKVNVDQLPQIAHQYAVTGLPTDVILTPQGQVIQSFNGRVDSGQFLARMNQVAAVYRQQRGAPATQVAGVGTPGGVNPPPAAGENFPAIPVIAASVAKDRPANSPPNNPLQPNTPAVITPPLLTGPSTPGPILASPAQPYGQPPALPAPNGVSAGQGLDQNFAGGARPEQPVTQPPSAPPAVSNITPKDSLPAGNPPKGLEGFCPVTLWEKQRWIQGDLRYGGIHRGRTYLFAGPEEQRRFFADPDRFAPVNSGNDLVLSIEQGKSVPGMRTHGVYYANHVFLFADEASLGRFEKNPAYYAKPALDALRASTSPRPPAR
jgi:thioredoxin-related protein